MGNIRRSLALFLGVVVASSASGGCVSWSRTMIGSTEFRDTWRAEDADSRKSWADFKNDMPKWLSAQNGKPTVEAAVLKFKTPTQSRVADWGQAHAWYYGEGKLVEWDVFVAAGYKMHRNDFVLAMSFDMDGRLVTWELASASMPTTMRGGTTKRVVEAVALMGGAALIALTMDAVISKAQGGTNQKINDATSRVLDAVKQGQPSGSGTGLGAPKTTTP